MIETDGDILIKLYDGSGGVYDRSGLKESTVWEYRPGGLRVPRQKIIDLGIKISRMYEDNPPPVTVVDLDLASLVERVREDKKPKAGSGASLYLFSERGI